MIFQHPYLARLKTSKGFTLLEMILVLFLISLMASSILFLTENVEDQAKYDETKRRMEIIRQAIVGDPTRTLNGQTEISGFVSDMGRLPGCIRELLEQQYCIDASGALESWKIDVSTGIASGWRGPYIQVSPERNGNIRFRDGYANTGTDVSNVTGTNSDASASSEEEKNSGWTWALYDSTDAITTVVNDAESIRIQSYGFDGTNKYPQGSLSSITKLIDKNDYRTYLQNWDTFELTFNNTSAGIISIDADSLRVKLSYTENGEVNVWPSNDTDRENSDYLSSKFPLTDLYISNGFIDISSTSSVTVTSGTSLSGTSLTIGSMGDITFPSSQVVSVQPGDILIVPTGSILTGQTLSISIGTVVIPDYDLNISLQFPENITPVTGSFSLIIACDDTVNESSISGQRFDGDCTRYGTDLSPIDYSPISQPYIFQMPARSTSKTPPVPFTWTIQ